MISGSIVASVGLVLGMMSLTEDQSNSDKQAFQILSLVHLAVGVPLFCVGLTKKRVFVMNTASVSLAPTITRNGGTLGLAVTF